MGAGAVHQSSTGELTGKTCRVGGDFSSFRAEAAAMYQAIYHADPHIALVMLTDSMNVVQALQAWDHAEFLRDMTWQRNADIIVKILLAINNRSAPLTIPKMKSHRGVELNEIADGLADTAATPPPEGEDDELDTLCVPAPPDSAMTYQWMPEGAEDAFRTADHRLVMKRWDATDNLLTTRAEQLKDSYACQLMTHPGWGQHLWLKPRRVRPWTEAEERRWLQMVGRVFPVNTYLRRIDKHPTGDCDWCGAGVQETQAHFHCMCPQFTEPRTAAHHNITRAVVAHLKDLRLANWEFFYETELKNLPFKFKWASEREELKQAQRRPDGVAWNPVLGKVIFLEFTRAMDNPDNMAAACEAKGNQYAIPMRALRQAQRSREHRHPALVTEQISTAPLIFGVRGAVLMDVARESLTPLQLTGAQLDRVLASGVRAAVTVASSMCAARFAAKRSLPAAPRGPNGQRVKIRIPQKPFQSRPWRSERGWTQQTQRPNQGQR